jgi:hypothetical protein
LYFHIQSVSQMNRQQKARRVLESKGQVFHVRDFGLVEVRFLSPNYAFEECDGTLTATGRLDIFRLSARDPLLPGFAARWDGGNRYGHEQFDLDIDMVNAGNDEIAKFRRGQDGYTGHHAIRTTVPTGHHRYAATIAIPHGVVFDATCSFTLHRQVSVTVKAEARVWCDAQVIRATPES